MPSQPLDHFKRGYSERANMRERDVRHHDDGKVSDAHEGLLLRRAGLLLFSHALSQDDHMLSRAAAHANTGDGGGRHHQHHQPQRKSWEPPPGPGGQFDRGRGGRGAAGPGGYHGGREGGGPIRGGGRGQHHRRDGDPYGRGRPPHGGGGGHDYEPDQRRQSHPPGRRDPFGDGGRGIRRGDGPPVRLGRGGGGFSLDAVVDRLCQPRADVADEMDRARRASPESFASGKAITAIISQCGRRRQMRTALEGALWRGC